MEKTGIIVSVIFVLIITFLAFLYAIDKKSVAGGAISLLIFILELLASSVFSLLPWPWVVHNKADEIVEEIKVKFKIINEQENNYENIEINSINILYNNHNIAVKIEIPSGYDHQNYVREYYVEDNQLYFACISDANNKEKQNKLYFDEDTGNLVSFINETGKKVYDLNEFKDDRERARYEAFVNLSRVEYKDALILFDNEMGY